MSERMNEWLGLSEVKVNDIDRQRNGRRRCCYASHDRAELTADWCALLNIGKTLASLSSSAAAAAAVQSLRTSRLAFHEIDVSVAFDVGHVTEYK